MSGRGDRTAASDRADRTAGDRGAGMDVAVVGAGAVGTTAAYDLAREGASVTLYEREEVAAGASGRAAGVLYDAFADRRDAAVGLRALERFREFSGTGEFEFTPRPYLWLAREGDEKRATAIREQVPRMADNGVDAELLDADDLATRFPGVEADDVAVAAVAEGAGYTDPASYVRTLAREAQSAGVTVRENAAVRVRAGPPRVLVGDSTPDEARAYDAVLVATGARTKQVLAEAGIEVPLKPYRVQALTGGPAYDGPMVYDATAGFYCRPHPRGLLAGDGTEAVEADPDDWDREGDDWFVDDLRGRLAERLGVGLDLERAWAGLCTATPDRDPLLGDLRGGLYVAAGWQGHGFMRSPALGEAIADRMLGGAGVEGFDPGRFDGDETFEIVEGMAVEE